MLRKVDFTVSVTGMHYGESTRQFYILSTYIISKFYISKNLNYKAFSFAQCLNSSDIVPQTQLKFSYINP